jgi:hypothetical protein
MDFPLDVNKSKQTFFGRRVFIRNLERGRFEV